MSDNGDKPRYDKSWFMSPSDEESDGEGVEKADHETEQQCEATEGEEKGGTDAPWSSQSSAASEVRYDKGYFVLTDEESDGDYYETEAATYQEEKKDDTADGRAASLSSSPPAAHEARYHKSYFESSDDESDGEWRLEAMDHKDEIKEEMIDGAGARSSSGTGEAKKYDPSLFESFSDDEEYGEEEQDDASAAMSVTQSALAHMAITNERNATSNEPELDFFFFDSGYTDAFEPPPTRNRPLRPSDSDRELGPGAQACSNVYKALVYQLASTVDHNKPDEDWDADEPKYAKLI